ncbi:hypothetical protein BH10PAT3_BH10PAT3_6150 [soil metagenome]
MKKLRAKSKKLSLRVARIIARTSLPEIAFITTLILGKYLKNADFSYPSELIIPILFFGLLATVIFYKFRLIIRDWLAVRVATLLSIYAMYSYSYLPSWISKISKFILPKSIETTFSVSVVTTVLVLVICGALGYGAGQMAKRFVLVRNLQVHKVILFALLFVSVIQFVKVSSRWVSMRAELAYSYDMPSYTQDKTKITSKPDIYYFVFDRYANAKVLKDNYNYDNSNLMSFLSDKGFVNKETALSNYPFTMQSISSTLRMGYNTELKPQFNNGKIQAAFPYRDILNNPPVAKLLKQNGYTYNQVNSWWDFTRIAVNADNHPTDFFRLRLLAKNFYLSDFTRDIIYKSVMAPWFKKGVTFGSHSIFKYDNDGDPRQNFFAQEKALKAIAGRADRSPQFTFTHVLAPHDPYLFDAEGAQPKYDGGRNDNGVDEKVKYTDEMTYLNTQIKDIMGNIRSTSPNAVIIIQADEGPYPKQFRTPQLTPTNYYDPSDLNLSDELQKFGILASYYMPGVEKAEVAANMTSSVNSFRFVLSHYLGYDLPQLPDCQFSAGNKFKIFNFQNQTAKLQPNPSTACNNL